MALQADESKLTPVPMSDSQYLYTLLQTLLGNSRLDPDTQANVYEFRFSGPVHDSFLRKREMLTARGETDPQAVPSPRIKLIYDALTETYDISVNGSGFTATRQMLRDFISVAEEIESLLQV